MIIMIILVLGTTPFSFAPLITLGFSIGVMKWKIKMIFQIGSKNGGYFFGIINDIFCPQIFEDYEYFTEHVSHLVPTPYSQVLFFFLRFQTPWILCWDFVLSQMILAHFPGHLEK